MKGNLEMCAHATVCIPWMYIIEIIDNFAPPPLSKKYFFPQLKFALFSLFSTSYPFNSRLFLNTSSYFSPINLVILPPPLPGPGGGANEKYTPLLHATGVQ